MLDLLKKCSWLLAWGFLGLGVALVGLGAAPGAAAGAPPQVSLGETSHDFGKVFEDQELAHTFVLRNTGGGPLRILEVDPDCDCTAARYDRVIPPGGQGEITLSIKPYSVLRQFKKETKVRVNDPERQEVVFVLKGVAQPFIEIQPSHVIRFRGDPKEEMKAQVRFTSHLPTPWEIKEYRSNIQEHIEVALKAEEPGRVYVLEVRNKRREGGHYGGIIELLTTSKERPRLIVRVFADLYPASAVYP